MTRFTILALTTIAALLATYTSATAAETQTQLAKAQGNRPQSSQMSESSVVLRLVIAQGETSIVRTKLQNTVTPTITPVEADLPVIADYSDLPSELWQLRPQVQNAD